MNAETTEQASPDGCAPNVGLAAGVQQMSARIADAATGLSILLAAVVVSAAFALLYAMGNHSSPYYAAAWIAILAGLGLLHWPLFFWIQRRRARAGLPLVEARRPSPARIVVLAAALGLYLVGGYLLMTFVNAHAVYRFGLIVPFGVLFGLGWGAYGLRRRQWEDVVQGLALGAVTGVMAFDPSFPPELWLTLFAFCFVPGALVKHLRWRTWVRSLRPRGEEPTAQGVQP